jgi:hypothetical protein
MFVEPWREMRDTQKTIGMSGWAGQRASGAMSGVGALAGNSMVQITALIAAIGALGNARTQYNEWKEKWDPETGGIAETELDNLSEYNEKLGLATRSLQQFKKGLDESNPARTDDIGAELSQNWNVRDFGRSMEELTSERLGTIKTVEQAKEWISAQGTMNADQWVLVMRDFSKIFKNNTAVFEELNTWVQENQSNGRVPPAGGIKMDKFLLTNPPSK